MPTVFNKIRDSVVIAKPMIAIVLPPYRSYNEPETKVMTDSRMVPGTNKKPDRNALVPSTVCENIGSIVSVDKSSIILMKISINESVKVLFLNKFKFKTGAGSLNCLVTKNHNSIKPIKIGARTMKSIKPYTLTLLNPNMNRENPIADNIMEVISRLTLFFFNTFFIRKIARTKVMRTSGRSTQCSERQSSTSMITPEIDGAEAGATFVTAPSIPIANPRR